ncbi:MAG: 50S ribosomal protein L25 [Deltaproteobacteria bacterium]|jgi:large subunit ribosomal protein L25|nr:50S ribosomal protein L25 [Deltaproteobacteria bacterium]
MNQLTLSARIRTETGKGAARRLRQNNQIPAIFYGPGVDPVMLTIEYAHLSDLEKAGKGENAILDLIIQTDQGETTKKVMIKELTFDLMENTFLHADFYEISSDRKLTLAIPVHLLNTPIGVTEGGGVLQQIRREVTIVCFPDKLVEFLEVDISDLDVGDTVRIGDLALPEGIETTDGAHLTVAVVNIKGSALADMEAEEEVEEELEEGVEGEETEEADGSEKETAEETKE